MLTACLGSSKACPALSPFRGENYGDEPIFGQNGQLGNFSAFSGIATAKTGRALM